MAAEEVGFGVYVCVSVLVLVSVSVSLGIVLFSKSLCFCLYQSSFRAALDVLSLAQYLPVSSSLPQFLYTRVSLSRVSVSV